MLESNLFHNVTSKIFLSPHEHYRISISTFPETKAHGCYTSYFLPFSQG